MFPETSVKGRKKYNCIMHSTEIGTENQKTLLLALRSENGKPSPCRPLRKYSAHDRTDSASYGDCRTEKSLILPSLLQTHNVGDNNHCQTYNASTACAGNSTKYNQLSLAVNYISQCKLPCSVRIRKVDSPQRIKRSH